MTSRDGAAAAVSELRRASLRRAAALVSAGIAVLYVVVFFVQLPHMNEPDNPAPVFVLLALVYAVGALLVARRDGPGVQWVGATVQVILIGLLAWIVVGSYAHEGVDFFVDMLWLVLSITAAQVLLLGVLVHLARGGARPGGIRSKNSPSGGGAD